MDDLTESQRRQIYEEEKQKEGERRRRRGRRPGPPLAGGHRLPCALRRCHTDCRPGRPRGTRSRGQRSPGPGGREVPHRAAGRVAYAGADARDRHTDDVQRRRMGDRGPDASGHIPRRAAVLRLLLGPRRRVQRPHETERPLHRRDRCRRLVGWYQVAHRGRVDPGHGRGLRDGRMRNMAAACGVTLSAAQRRHPHRVYAQPACMPALPIFDYR